MNEMEKLRNAYKQDPRQSSVRILLMGQSGTGKTRLIGTSRKPVHIDSFDPGGTLTIRKFINAGSIVADTAYELERPEKPSVFERWATDFENRFKSGYFEKYIQTYVLDSSTKWADSIMNFVLKKNGMSGEAPRFQDYNTQKAIIQKCLSHILTLPCDVIVTGHLTEEREKQVLEKGTKQAEFVDIVTGYKYFTVGQGAITIPLLFDEKWITVCETVGVRNKYSLITAPYNLYKASTRIGADIFSSKEEPDICKLLEKAGWPTDDKEQPIESDDKESVK